ncbi:hypothetical protein F7725_021475 [Dissostichus mawsoni]|uniref:Uncharacterized protein n=1 Tax=Dissostichus mawsoni TaxID=36200 RepID=A0A7J5ZBI4_DISMA|nr:hypothetical protein F7725_021475 [Dissostichus mawsoni]
MLTMQGEGKPRWLTFWARKVAEGVHGSDLALTEGLDLSSFDAQAVQGGQTLGQVLQSGQLSQLLHRGGGGAVCRGQQEVPTQVACDKRLQSVGAGEEARHQVEQPPAQRTERPGDRQQGN